MPSIKVVAFKVEDAFLSMKVGQETDPQDPQKLGTQKLQRETWDIYQ